jgi:hypothetical protein
MTDVQITHCPRHGYVVMWFGQAHGLPHVKPEDAEQHAQALRDAEDWDKAQWRGWR